jgi:hypothetical protein
MQVMAPPHAAGAEDVGVDEAGGGACWLEMVQMGQGRVVPPSWVLLKVAVPSPPWLVSPQQQVHPGRGSLQRGEDTALPLQPGGQLAGAREGGMRGLLMWM